MQLPHIQGNVAKTTPTKATLGPKSLRALTQPIKPLNTRKQTELDPDTFTMGIDNVLAPPDPAGSWRTLETQRKNLLDLPYTSLSQLALDLSPQVNKGLWDWVRFGNPGHILEDQTNARSDQAAKAFAKKMGRYYGNFKNHLDSMWASIFVYGGLFTELVLGSGGKYPVDIAVNNPLSIRFQLTYDEERGQVYQAGQMTRSGFVPFTNPDLARYTGFDRIGNNPYGRPLIAPAVHASLFLLGLISDLRRAVANAGLSRMDYALQSEELLRLIDRNPDIAGDDEATAQFINDQIDTIQSVLNDLDVDSDYVHLDTVVVNYATNPMQTNIAGIDSLVTNLQRDVTNGMKAISALSNVLDSTTETHITKQLEYYVAAIGSVQGEVNETLTDYFQIGNQVQGIRGNVLFRQKKQRTADQKQEAEREKIQTDTILAKYDKGVISRDEAREELDSIKDELVVA